MYFGDAPNHKENEVGIFIISSQGPHIPISIKLDFEVTNNATEHEACIIGMQTAQALQINSLECLQELKLIHKQDHHSPDGGRSKIRT